jgi:hypothetical protein
MGGDNVLEYRVTRHVTNDLRAFAKKRPSIIDEEVIIAQAVLE